MKQNKNFFFDALQNELREGPASPGEDQETGVVRWTFVSTYKFKTKWAREVRELVDQGRGG